MRLYKSRGELSLMRQAANIAARAHVRAMKRSRPGVYEFEVMAELLRSTLSITLNLEELRLRASRVLVASAATT